MVLLETVQRLIAEAGGGSIITGSGVPVTTPSAVGIIYIDTTNKNAYIATGTSSASDWEQIDGGGGSISDGDKGDITVSGSGGTWTIDNDVVTYAKLQNVSATSRLLGRASIGVGDVEELTATQAKTILAIVASDISNFNTAVSANTDVAANTAARHTRQHAITSTSDHTSAATSGQLLKADANGLPINATNTDAQVAAAVTASHAAATVSDTSSIDMSITGQQISGVVLPAGVDHNSLANLTTADPHTQYVLKSLYDANTMLYATTDNTPAALTVGTNTVVGRVAGNITTLAVDSDLSSVSANNDTVPSAKATKAYADTKMTNPMITSGDMIYGDTSGAPLRLPLGTTGQVLVADAANGNIEWGDAGVGSIFTWRGAWVTSTAYSSNDCVQESGNGYVCLVDHTSGTFATDLAAGKWSLFVEKGDAGPAVADGDKGDITVSGSGATWTIDNDAVTYAKIQNVSATSRLLGRTSAGAGDIEELTATQAKTLLAIVAANISDFDTEVSNNTDVAANTSARHARQHAITSTSDHTSSATSGQMLKADANGLPVNATNTDAQVAAAVTAIGDGDKGDVVVSSSSSVWRVDSLTDTNGNELIKTTATASAVNELTIANAATNNAPTVTASGGDTDIDLSLLAKGDGSIKSTVHLQAITTNTNTNGVFVQAGWSYVDSLNGTSRLEKTITFPKAFSAPPLVLVTTLGIQLTGTPTSPASFTNAYGQQYSVRSTSATNFIAGVNDTAGSINWNFGFSWIAIGT